MKNLLFLLLLLFCFSPTTFGQSRKWNLSTMLKLQEKNRKLAEASIPKTVLVRSLFSTGRDKQGAGSGAIISEDGYILTCSHVVSTLNTRGDIEPAKFIEVELSDGTLLPAKRLGYNDGNDYSLLKVESPKPLPFFELGNSDEVQIGDWVMAVGHPGGANVDRKASCSLGQVTELHFKLPAQAFKRYYGNAIKSDTPIFSGNSGGPLIDLEGKLIGINAAILLQNEDSFSIPINEIREVLTELKAGKKIPGYTMNDYPSAFKKALSGKNKGGFLGARTEALKKDVQEILEISEGASVREVLENSPASKAGLRVYDVILEIDGKTIHDPYHLSETVRSYKPYTQTTFKILRKGEILSLRVTIGRQP